MVERTSTVDAPWMVISAENKLHARIAVLETVVRSLDHAVS
jgi:polyphosphate kinase 2 (PPK2 family)